MFQLNQAFQATMQLVVPSGPQTGSVWTSPAMLSPVQQELETPGNAWSALVSEKSV